MVINRICKLDRDKSAAGWTILKFLPEKGKPEEMNRFVLPNLRLEEMETIAAKDADTVFLVSGECTVYRDRPYIIVRLALTQPKQVEPAPTPKPSDPPRTTHPTTTTAPDSDDMIRSLLDRMLSERAGKPILQEPESSAKVEPMPSVSPAVARQLPQAYGSMVADRTVYLTTDSKSGWTTVSFIGDNTVQEQPVRLLPCLLAIEAKDLAKSKLGRTLRLRVSGELTRYRGNEYLLLRKVLREREMNQF
jgi:hypothetical protein